jgi:glycosyltransferase involved in cell wall biosynthesis
VALSVCIITRNEEYNIEACLRSASFADEWIVVDSHSEDRTREIAESLGARVCRRDWTGFADQKRFAIAQASHEWVLLLDADERVSPELRTAILAAIAAPGAVDGYTMPRLNHYMGRAIRHGGWYPDRKLRLFRKHAAHIEDVDVHERVRVTGTVHALNGNLLHYSYRSLSHHLGTIDRYTTLAAQQKHGRGQRATLIDLTLRPWGKFVRMYILRAGFLDGLPGFVIALMGGYYVFLKYAKLRELQLVGNELH